MRWVDFLKYDARVPPAAEVPPDFWLKLTHLNPLFQNQFFTSELKRPLQLMVPVAKDGHIQPGD